MKNFGKLLKEAQKMQAEIARIQQELQEKTFTGTAGGGVVKVTVTGTQEPLEVKIDPAVFEDADAEMLEEMILGALKDALAQAKEYMESEMAKVTGGLGGFPGLPGGMA